MKTGFDVIVIGGGPAGMMAAARASARGRSVLLLEKNIQLGNKLSITGGGRCNVTNNKPVVREMLSQYKSSGKFLFSTFMQHGVKETIEWFKERGVNFIEENEGRMFPASQKAETIRQTLVDEIKKSGVIINKGKAVKGITYNKSKKQFSVSTGKDIFLAKSCVVATGGTSRPETGSSGEGFLWLQSLGHKVAKSNMALVPLKVRVSWLDKLKGVTLKDIKITLLADNKKDSSHNGKLLFTPDGVTGPTVLNLSQTVGELLEHSAVVLKIDLLPSLDSKEVKDKLQEIFTQSSNKKVKNVLGEFIPIALGVVLLKELGIDTETPCHSVSRPNRKQLLTLLKAFPLPIKGLLGADKAIVSDGGVFLEEVDFKTMESRVVPGLYLVGDVLNINRPSGGYSLQLCWSTGFVAGSHV